MVKAQATAARNLVSMARLVTETHRQVEYVLRLTDSKPKACRRGTVTPAVGYREAAVGAAHALTT